MVAHRVSAAALCCLLTLWSAAVPCPTHAARILQQQQQRGGRAGPASAQSRSVLSRQPDSSSQAAAAAAQQPAHVSSRTAIASALGGAHQQEQHPAANSRAAAVVLPARALLRERDWGDVGDGSGLGGILGARVIQPRAAQINNRNAVTPEAAESSAASSFVGVFRPTTAESRRSYATVEGVQGTNPNRDKETVRPRTRSAQDLRGMAPKAPNLGTGDENIGAVTMGSMAVAETYEGAEAFAASDSVAMTVRTRKAATSTTVAASMLTSRAPAINRRADGANARSSAVSAGIPVGSLAAAGQANSKIVLAQAESAVALSQTARGNADSWSIGQTG